MKKISRLLAILIMVMMTATPFMSFATEEEFSDAPETDGTAIAGETADLSDMTEDNAVADELLVLVEKGTKKREIADIADDAGASLDNVATLDNGTKLAKVTIGDPDEVQAVADEILSDDKVLIVQPNYIYTLETKEDEGIASEDIELIGGGGSSGVSEQIMDGKWITQWYMGETAYESGRYPGSARIYEAWDDLTAGKDPVTVAVIDTGAKLDHPDLQDNIIAEKCVTYNKGKKGGFDAWDGSYDDHGHGTHVCGTIASKVESESERFGISGVSDNRAQLIVIDAALPNMDFTSQDVVLAINYAIEENASVINMSIGGLYHDYAMEECINHAFNEKNILCVCAAGNENSELPDSPGDAAGAISVRAHDAAGNKAYFSNYGYEKDVSAPGVGIVSTYIDKSGNHYEVVYTLLNGTSMASPVVAGLAALLKSEDPTLSARELKNLIYTSSISSGSPPFDRNEKGFGCIDAHNAVISLKGSAEPSSIVLNRTSANMYPDEYIDLEYAVYPGTSSRHADEIEFSSSDAAVADVDEYGRITANTEGTAVITAKYRNDSNIKETCTVTVNSVPVENISRLPYYRDGYFEPTDPKVRFTYNGESFEVMADSYSAQLSAGNNIVEITVGCDSAKPYVRVYGPDGSDLGVTQTISKNSGYYRRTASFIPSVSGSYLIQILGDTDGSEKVNKPYSLDVRVRNNPIPISDTSISGVSNREYTGEYLTQDISVRYGSILLRDGTDYTVSYSDNVNAGTGYVIITGVGNYSGSVSIPFSITPKRITPAVALSASALTWNNKAQMPAVAVYDGGNQIPASQYTVSYSGGSKNIGTYSATVQLGGNYSGTGAVTYEIVPKSAGIAKPSKAKKAVTVKWKKQATKMSGGYITGYQVQVSTDPGFAMDVKTVNVKGYKKTSKKVGGLKAKKKYYVRVRTYKNVGGMTYYSGWSGVKSVKTK